MNGPIFESILTCPKCGFAKTETMPTDACRFFYRCVNCEETVKPNAGDCCVFCSFGSVKCPPIQMPIGYIPPSEAEANYYLQLAQTAAAAVST